MDAASGLCRLLWIMDSGEPGLDAATGVLRKIGKVIDAADCTAQELVQLVYAEHPDGVTSYFDSDLHRQAWLAAALDLPSPSVRAAALLTDKLLQRGVLEAAGVSVPKFSEVREPADRDEVTRLCGILDFPMVLKPRDGTGCRDISLVTNVDELTHLLGEEEHPSRMILEERMEDLPPSDAPYADRVSIDSIVSRGVTSHLGITGLFPMMPPFRSSGGFFPADVDPADIPELFEMATASIQALSSDFGCYRTEIKLTPQGHKIIEVNGRPTGLTPRHRQVGFRGATAPAMYASRSWRTRRRGGPGGLRQGRVPQLLRAADLGEEGPWDYWTAEAWQPARGSTDRCSKGGGRRG